jgi:5-(carboxyamino)imidazole ribonucleotide mutase
LFSGINFYFLIFIYLAFVIDTIIPENNYSMEAKVSIIMGSTSDLPIMEEAAKILNEFQIHFEIHALSAHRTPDKVMEFAKNAYKKGIRVIIAGAGGAAHLPGVVAALTPIPVIGVPIKAGISIDGWDSILSILQMPPGVPVATVGLNSAMNAGILAVQIIAAGEADLMKKVVDYKARLAQKIEKANTELAQIKFDYKVG